jgi:hypothetical protein
MQVRGTQDIGRKFDRLNSKQIIAVCFPDDILGAPTPSVLRIAENDARPGRVPCSPNLVTSLGAPETKAKALRGER